MIHSFVTDTTLRNYEMTAGDCKRPAAAADFTSRLRRGWWCR